MCIYFSYRIYFRCQYQRVFDTVRCASVAAEPTLLMASTPIASNSGMPPRLTITATTPLRTQINPSLQKAQSVLKELTASLETDYP